MTYASPSSVIRVTTRSPIPVIRDLFFSAIPDKITTAVSGDGEKRFEDLGCEIAVWTLCGVVGHEVYDEVMCDGRHKACEGLDEMLDV